VSRNSITKSLGEKQESSTFKTAQLTTVHYHEPDSSTHDISVRTILMLISSYFSVFKVVVFEMGVSTRRVFEFFFSPFDLTFQLILTSLNTH